MRANPGGIVGPEDVIGRDDLIAELWQTLEKQSVVLTSERRIGKTSVIRKMKDEKKGPGRPKGFVFHFRPPDNKFTLNLKFKRSEVSKNEIISTLRELIDNLAKS